MEDTKPKIALAISFLACALVFLTKQVFLIACMLVLIEKCIIGRLNPTTIGGIEFTTISTILVTLKYGLLPGIYFCIFLLIAPGIVNAILGDRWVYNPSFNPSSIGPGNPRDFIAVLLIYFLSGLGLSLVWIMLIVLAFKNFAKYEGFGEMDLISIPVNFIFNLILLQLLNPILPYLL